MPLIYIGTTSSQDYLAHHGILGQKWGIRRFQNPDGTLTEDGKKHYGRKYGISDHKPNAFEKLVGGNRRLNRMVAESNRNMATYMRERIDSGKEKKTKWHDPERLYRSYLGKAILLENVAQIQDQVLNDYSKLSDHEKEIIHGEKWLKDHAPIIDKYHMEARSYTWGPEMVEYALTALRNGERAGLIDLDEVEKTGRIEIKKKT